MPASLEISLAPERLEEGSAEERACFGLFTIRCGAVELTAGLDSFVAAYRAGPLVSGYHAAEWFAWNWWRLRHEPRTRAPDWWRAHRMTAIGEGYVWPNLAIWSDGVRTVLHAEPSPRPDARPFRYLGAHPCVVPSEHFEQALDRFVPQIIGRLRDRAVGDTNLDRLWSELTEERRDPGAARRRRLEALMGQDPDEASEAAVDQLLADAEFLGEQAVEELAADVPQGDGGLPSAAELSHRAETGGYASDPRDMVRLAPGVLPGSAEVPAWWLGAAAAQALRKQAGLSGEVLSDERLADLAGVEAGALADTDTGSPLSFTLDCGGTGGRLVLRSRWKTGRRFELARLLADHLVASQDGCLHVATRAYTYRQKMQRAFAAEFLSPFEAVCEMLGGDYSAEAQADVAAYFRVSDLTIRTLLVAHRRVERDELDEDVVQSA
jgi:hypothetical protein